MLAYGYNDKQLAVVREMAANDEPDHVIGERLGFHPRKVCAIRKANGIPPSNRRKWSKETVENIRQWYVVEGLPAGVVAKRIGCSPSAIRRVKSRHGWERSPEAEAKNREVCNQRIRAGLSATSKPLGRKPKPKAEKVEKVEKPLEAIAKPKKAFEVTSRTIFNLKAEEKPYEPLDLRIMRELKTRALNAPTIATLIGEKELYVSQQLSAMAHEGRVNLTGGEGRFKVWEAA